MTKTQYKRALKALGLSVNQAGPFLGISSRQSFRIASGAAEIPEAARKLLLLLLYNGQTPALMDQIVADEKNVARRAGPASPPEFLNA